MEVLLWLEEITVFWTKKRRVESHQLGANLLQWIEMSDRDKRFKFSGRKISYFGWTYNLSTMSQECHKDKSVAANVSLGGHFWVKCRMVDLCMHWPSMHPFLLAFIVSCSFHFSFYLSSFSPFFLHISPLFVFPFLMYSPPWLIHGGGGEIHIHINTPGEGFTIF